MVALPAPKRLNQPNPITKSDLKMKKIMSFSKFASIIELEVFSDEI